MELINISHLSKSYAKTKVLDNLSLTYHSGMIYGLVGENGAGKTTLFNCIMGITDYKGSIQKASGVSIGYLPAENHFYTLITGQEYLDFCIRAKGKNLEKSKLKEANEVFRLPLQRYASEYSTGMKKKLALMALFLQDNDVYILDEPFNGVDLYGCIQLKKTIYSLKSKGKTLLLSSHQITILRELCDCIDYLSRHTIVQRYTDESVEEIEKSIFAESVCCNANAFAVI